MIKGIRAGRESSYARLFDMYYRPLSVFAVKYVNDLDIAKEIVQDFFVHLYENRESLVISTSLQSYLYQSVRNRSLNHIKHQQVQKKHLDHLSHSQDTTEELEEIIRVNELEHRIFQIISELPPRCREIFQMSRVNGKPNKEIAKQLGISIRTVETQISNALKALRKKLGEDISS